jgi:hypothetical protein
MTDRDRDLNGMVLAVTDGASYWRVDWIVEDSGDGWPRYYCNTDEWPATPIGRLATKDARIAELEQRIADLDAQLASHAVPAAVAAAAAGMDAAESKRTGGVAARIPCPICGNRVWPNKFDAHMAIKHPSEPAAPTAAIEPTELPMPVPTHRPPPRESPVQAPPETPPPLAFGTWRCRVCESDVFAASKHDPTICLRCAKTHQNGHAAEIAEAT